MATLVDYVRYNELPSLEEANISLQGPSIDDIINGPVRNVFLKHAADTFCLYLLHRHHTISTDNAVVKVKGTAHLMDNQAIRDIVSFGNKVVPTTWMISSDRVLPMEFAVVPAATTTPAPTPAFQKEFLSVLASNGCNGLFGIDTIAEGDWSEIKIGDASVVVPNDDNNTYNKDKFTPVAFKFDKKEPGFRVHGRCGKDHKHSSKPS